MSCAGGPPHIPSSLARPQPNVMPVLTPIPQPPGHVGGTAPPVLPPTHGYNAAHLPFSSQFAAAAEVPRNIGVDSMSVSDNLTTATGLSTASNYRVRYKSLLRPFTIDDGISLKDAFKKFQLKFQCVYRGQVVPNRERYEKVGNKKICMMVFSCNC